MKNVALLFILTIISACMPDSGGGGKKLSLLSNGSTLPTATPTVTPLPNAANFLQQGVTQTNSILALPSGFTDSFMARGNQINAYLNGNSNSSIVLCMIANFATNPDNKIGVFAAIPLYFNNLTTGAREYYFQMQPSEKAINQVNCQTAGLVNSLLTAYPGKTPVFSLAEICPSCGQPITSDGLKLITNNGVNVQNADLTGVRIQVGATSGSPNSGGTCTSSANCIGLGYDCCISNQCVLDGRVKDNMSVPLSIQTEIASNPANFKNYPEYYYICPINVPTPTPTPDTSNSEEVAAALRLERLQELYDCTKKGTDEENICTITFDNVKNDIINSGLVGAPFTAAIDDLNFSTINSFMSNYNITEVSYAGELLYRTNPSVNQTSRISFVVGSNNDNLVTGQTVLVKGAPPAQAAHDLLKIKYKVDGSCERLGSQLARCKKYYVQGQTSTPAKVSDHLSGLTFKLPSYADTNYVVQVHVNDIVVPRGGSTWDLSSNNVVFSPSNPIMNGQRVVITYYVSSSLAANVVTSNFSALTEINSICAGSNNNSCGNGNCGLTPVTQTSGGVTSVVDYSCVYPQPDVPEAPMQQTVYVSAKSVPHRYFDQGGVGQDELDVNTLQQEGLPFSYTNNNLVKPINVSSYVGINEIFGSMKNSDPSGTQPAKRVLVKKGRQYDIWVESGFFTPCASCGNDYYSSLQKVFPSNFEFKGAGYRPSTTASSRTANLTAYRADDLIFGRACFVPVTMIPWTHMANGTSVQSQRQNRLKAQHFMYANGYSRDWYGFDYGALIGSYDGVTWFSIGNQRRTTAGTNKLYLALNANFGDLTTANSFTVTISEVSAFTTGGSEVLNDFNSDGAECQQYHVCQTDNDCLTKMGYEYSCQSVSTISTNWPTFNANAEEQPGSSNVRTIGSIIGGLVGGPKRCVYRARGAPCAQNFSAVVANAAYTGSTSNPGLYACNHNNYCESITTSRFNNKIARYGKGPASVNVDTAGTTDTFGLGAKLPGRPLEFNGTQSVDSTVQAQLSDNELKAICIPGRDPNSTVISVATINKTVPGTRNGDKILGIGTTPSSSQAAHYVNQCATLDASGNYYHYQASYSSLLNNNATIKNLSASQNVPVNTYNIPVGSVTSLGTQYEIFTPSTGLVTKLGLQQNSCLRAPGASCQTEMDCSVSKFVTNKMNSVSSIDFLANYNEAEFAYLKETLVCSQDKDPVLDKDTYELKDNRCCRETNSKMTIYSRNFNTSDNTINTLVLRTDGQPGIDYTFTNQGRYSRTAPANDELGAGTAPALTGLIFDPSAVTSTSSVNSLNVVQVANTSQANFNIQVVLAGQYNTLHEIASKTCCSKNWVRSFATGGHKWQNGKTQNLNKEIFRQLSWTPKLSGGTPFLCTTGGNSYDVGTANCRVRNLSPAQETSYLNWFGLFELTGIPQIEIDKNGIQVTVNSTQDTPAVLAMPYDSAGNLYIPNTATPERGTKYAANQKGNFFSSLKQIFSDKEFNCCIGTDKTNLPATVSSDMCCTGTKYEDEQRCCLPDYTDVSVYLNRYVSSEGVGLSSASYDTSSGYIKDPGAAYLLAAGKGDGKTICCSGKMVYGRAIATLRVPGAASNPTTTRRFAYDNTNIDNAADQGAPTTSIDQGVRWNNHIYCVPSDFPDAQ